MLTVFQHGYPARMRIYLSEMFPPFERIVQAVLLCGSFLIGLSWIYKTEFQLFSPNSLLAIWSGFMLLLILRLMDELKDRDIDEQLFRSRPLPSGRVKVEDIWASLISASLLFLIPNALIRETFPFALLVLLYAVLMYKFFFIPDILKKYLLLNLLTHNPIIPIMLFYLTTLYLQSAGIPLVEANWGSTAAFIGLFWLMLFQWEFTRKIRAPKDEDDYVTYSQIFGTAGSIVIAILLQIFALVLVFFFWQNLQLSLVFPLVFLAGFGIVLAASMCFLLRPDLGRSKFRTYTEIYILSLYLAIIAEYATSLN